VNVSALASLGPLRDAVHQYPLIAIEAVLCAGLFILFLAIGPLPSSFHRLASLFARLANRRQLAVVFVFFVAIAAHLAVLPFLPPPIPGIHDEFSYLLLSDTFASGRLANPVHPMAIFFESFHIDQWPTYASMYPPAAGVALAAGQVLGHPIIGVWLAAALFCASLCWMLQAWLPPRWALFGGLVAVCRIGLFSYWANSFWGASVAAIGGCLLWGGVGRAIRSPRPASAIAMAAGVVILATSRPYEGAWVCLPAVAAIVVSIVRPRFPMRVILRQTILPAGAILLAGAAALGHYDARVFGNPFRLPYTVNRSLYAVAPTFLWQKARTPYPRYDHEVMKNFYTEFETNAVEGTGRHSTLALTGRKGAIFWMFFLGPALTLPLASYLLGRPGRSSARWPAAGFLSMLVGLAILAWPTGPHYYAPGVGGLYATLVEGFRRLRASRRRFGRMAPALTAAFAAALVLILPFRALADKLRLRADSVTPIPWHAAQIYPLRDRERVMARLRALGGRHLVVVRYAKDHVTGKEYVYNRADIDASDVVWAREVPNAIGDLSLVYYFRDRRAWLFCPDDSRLLFPYPRSWPDLGVRAEVAPTRADVMAGLSPTRPLTRDRLAVLLARARDGGDAGVPTTGGIEGVFYDCDEPSEVYFRDVRSTDPFCKHVHRIAALGWTAGCRPTRQYCPEQRVTRRQLAMFLGRAASPAGTPPSAASDAGTGRSYDCAMNSPFVDVPKGTPACQSIGYLWSIGAIDGSADTHFHPDGLPNELAAGRSVSVAFGVK